ncbi:IS200/IS605 family transposase [Hazenella sp. IB182357]|uniref:IS200/IS605 family transposase n=1 Tax=Polycladospora coralii TaxID=2771432 RepID=A0A926NBD2_9BACL|nr:IS200/IS605 family transposase [Polycladospora coralii]MBD1373433.1 IS200/IS605 family transposase [Polycladospora coralii]
MNDHLVLVIKYRRKVINQAQMFQNIGEKYNTTLLEWNHDYDHVHALFKAHSKTGLSKFINAYKSASSRIIKKEFPPVRKQLWKVNFGSRSFCLITTGSAPIHVVKQYIENQGKK